MRKQVFQGLAWRSSIDISEQILLIIFTAILARLLTRADFGLVAMALLFTRFIRIVTRIGFGAAIIQSQDVTEAQVSAIFFIQVALNGFISLGCFFAAPLAASFFKEPNLTPVIQTLSWLLLINSFAFPQILSRKQLKFAGYSLVELFSMIIGNLVGITLALKGYGVWALCFRLVSQRVLFSIIIWPILGWLPIKPEFSGVGKLFRFGLNMLGANVFYYFPQKKAFILHRLFRSPDCQHKSKK